MVKVETRLVSRGLPDKLFFLSCFLPVIETFYLLHGRFSFYTYLNGIPLTDSKGWFGCIKSLAYSESWPTESVDWCLRRPFYPLIASQIYKFMPNLNVYFIFCSLLFAIILLFTVGQVRKVCGDLAGWVTVIGASALWLVYGATQTLSEQVGISLGTLALGHFMRFVRDNRSTNLFLGSSFFLVAQLTRPGNAFYYLIPFLLVFLFGHQKLKLLTRLLVFCFFPLVFIVVSVRNFLGISNFMHSGNTWATIYGLQFNNQSWSASYSILPSDVNGETEIWSYIKNRTIQDISEHPLNIPKSILSNMQNIVSFGPLNLPIFLVLFSFFAYSLFYVYKNSILQRNMLVLIGFVLCTELTTYGISYNSEPIRTMSSSLVFSAALITLPISASLRYAWLSSRTVFLTTKGQSSQGLDYRIYIVSILTLLAIVLSPFESRSLKNLLTNPANNNQCKSLIKLNDFPSRYVQQQNLKDIRGTHGEWWIESIERLGGGSFLLATSVDQSGSSRDQSIYLRNSLIGDLRKGDRICIFTAEDQTLADIGFQEGTLLR